MSVKCQVALITGGAMGIGFQAAKSFLKREAKAVVFTDVNRAAGEKAEQKLCKEFQPGRSLFIHADVRDDLSSKRAFQTVIDTFGQLDIFFNNAAVIDEQVWKNSIDINFRGAINNMNIAFDVLRNYKSQEYGTILNNCSILAINAFYKIPVHCGAKHGLIAYSRAFSTEEFLKMSRCKIMCICPGVTETALLNQVAEDALEIARSVPQQTVEVCGEHSVDVVEKGQHGSIWVSEGSELYEIKFPEKGTNRKPIPEPDGKKCKITKNEKNANVEKNTEK